MKSTKTKGITFAIPAYNAGAAIISTVEGLLKSVVKNRIYYQIIIVNDGSTDSTKHALEKYIRRKDLTIVNLEKNQGLGNAIRVAIEKARNEYFIIYPADGDIDFKYINKYLNQCAPKRILASYFTNNQKRGLIRRGLSTLFNTIYIKTFSLPLHYINGPSFYPTKYLKQLTLKARRFSVVAEINVKLVKKGLEVKNVPMTRKTFDRGSSALKIKNLLEVIRIFTHLVKNKYH
ncbi:MAG: glycosyltransferase family 2 protein [Aliarcobacter sp.]